MSHLFLKCQCLIALATVSIADETEQQQCCICRTPKSAFNEGKKVGSQDLKEKMGFSQKNTCKGLTSIKMMKKFA